MMNNPHSTPSSHSSTTASTKPNNMRAKNNSQEQDNFLEDEKPSKSERKREMQALQEIGENIIALSDGEFATIPLEGELLTAILLARRLKSGEGRRRQMQYVGKLMRHADTTAIAA